MVTFDESLAKVFWNGKGNPSSQEKRAEAYRLYKEIKGYPSFQKLDMNGNTVTIPERKGIDLKTATLLEIKNFLQDNTIKKSDAIRKFCFKIIAIRFPDKYQQIIDLYPQFADMLQKYYNEKTDSDEWVGESGF